MTEHCWYAIRNFPTNIFNSLDFLDEVRDKNKIVSTYSADILTSNALDWGISRGLFFSAAIVFYRKDKNCPALPHTDLIDEIGSTPSPGLNIELEGNGIMRFYKLGNNVKEPPVMRTVANTPYRSYVGLDIKKIDETDFCDKNLIVRTDIPHSLDVVTAPRLLVSLRMTDKYSNVMTWPLLLDKLSADIISRC